MDTLDPQAWAPLLARGRWFGALDPARRQALLTAAGIRRLAAGEALFHRGDGNAGLFCVLEGALTIRAPAMAEGREVVLGQLEPPQWFGEIAFLDDGPRTHDAVSQGGTTMLCVPRPAVEALLAADPLWWRELGRLLAEKARAVFAGYEDLAGLPARQRVARRLLAIAQGHGMLAPGLSRRSVGVSQESLGAMLSLTRQTVSEVLRALETEGTIRRGYGAIDLLDPIALQRISAGR